ncbi:MAG TPA: serine hydrolase domain-containing protein [Bacteroidota bacterium]|nr:serine hydrolase domain-containing protein [Bacteroidota bacterium]
MTAIRCILLCLLFSWACFAQSDRDAMFRSRADTLFGNAVDPAGPGCSVFVQIDGRTLYQKSFGYADLKRGDRFTENTVANLGSITKTFVAYGILMLMEQGKLSLDDSVIKYFPDFKNKEIGRKVKIRHLLTHTSGLPDCRNVDGDSVFFLTANDRQNFFPVSQTDTLEFEPGTHWDYSNPSFNALALIIGQVSGMKWQKFIEQNIFKPSGMNDSKITDYAYPSEGVSHGYRIRENPMVPASNTTATAAPITKRIYDEYDYGEYPTFNAAGNGGVWSSINDLRKYYDAIQHATFADTGLIRLSETLWHPPNWADTLPPTNGFSWFVKDGAIYHSGHQAGFTAQFTMIPEKNFLLIFESNIEDLYEVQVKLVSILKEMNYL